MIRVTKPPAPAVLTNQGATAAAAHSADHDADPAGYAAGTVTFRFRSNVYGHATVRSALRAAQREKCAFCESRITATNYGDVEHYRPKGGYKQRRDDALGRPGYYWLAYDWDNLFLSCQLCNQEFKANVFPVRVQRDRARTHHDRLDAEEPLLLHPERDDPGRHLTFVGETIRPRNHSTRGASTIEVLGLDRPEMNEERLRRRQELLNVSDARAAILRELAVRSSPNLVAALANLDQILAAAVADDAEFAAMARVMLA